MVPHIIDQTAVAKHPPRERASSNSNGGKASANEPSDHGGKASARKQTSTLSVAKHLPERGPNSSRRHPLRQSIHKGGGLHTLNSKAPVKRRPATVTAKHPPKEKATLAWSSAAGRTIAVEYMKARQAQLGTSPATSGKTGTTDVDEAKGSSDGSG
jgi:hypothetical protein